MTPDALPGKADQFLYIDSAFLVIVKIVLDKTSTHLSLSLLPLHCGVPQ